MAPTFTNDANYVVDYGYPNAGQRCLTLGAYDAQGGDIGALRKTADFIGDAELVAAIRPGTRHERPHPPQPAG